MDRRKELKQQYKETKIQAGVYQIRNTKNQKIFIGSTSNLKTMAGQRMQLEGGIHRNKMLQKEWKEFGEEAFVFEVLEILEKKEEGFFDEKDALKSWKKNG